MRSASFFGGLANKASSKAEAAGKQKGQQKLELHAKHVSQELAFINLLGKSAAALGSLG